MKPVLKLATFGCLFFLCALWYWPRGHAACAGGTESQSCKPVVEALDAASKLKAGMLRADVEKDFDLDGGMTFQDRATYTYRRCRYIKVDVEFQKRDVPPNIQTFSQEDIVNKVSTPHLAYPATD
jgi:hypothetical protein